MLLNDAHAKSVTDYWYPTRAEDRFKFVLPSKGRIARKDTLKSGHFGKIYLFLQKFVGENLQSPKSSGAYGSPSTVEHFTLLGNKNYSIFLASYGDKVPKSYAAKAFSLVMTIIGISLVSLFTASITSSLSGITNNSEEKNPMVGHSIGVLNGSAERLRVLHEGAKPLGMLKILLLITVNGLGKLKTLHWKNTAFI